MSQKIAVAELFAGVGGFRLALEGYQSNSHPEFFQKPAGPFKVVWANQWEPPGTERRQFAWRCYEKRFGEGSCKNEDIAKVLDCLEEGTEKIPDFQMIVGGFPCQDYSVAKPLSKAGGIEGKKGVLWWEILRLIKLRHPRFVLLENVDRLLKSPAKQRGRDFAIILTCLQTEGYSIEWRVVNAADYGMPQKRRRVFIFATDEQQNWNLRNRVLQDGVMANAFAISEVNDESDFTIQGDPYEITSSFGIGLQKSPFLSAGAMQGNDIYTAKIVPHYSGKKTVLGDIVLPDCEIPESYFIPQDKLADWEYQRSSKSELRTTANGFRYMYSEGKMNWPDPLDSPARTILTGEGGSGASRMKHAIRGDSGRVRRLVPDELEMIQMFPRGWTNIGMTDGQRAFCMGNALVVEIPRMIGAAMTKLYGFENK